MGRIIRVRLFVNDRNEIRTEIEDPELEDEFNDRDAKDHIKVLEPLQKKSQRHSNKQLYHIFQKSCLTQLFERQV